MTLSSFKFLVVLVAGTLLGAASFAVWASTDESGPGPQLAAVGATTTSTLAPATTTTSTVPPTTTTTTSVGPTTTTFPRKQTLVIHGTGDVTPDPGYIPALAARGWDYAWSGLEGLFTTDDLTVINLECVPSDLEAAALKIGRAHV